MHRLTALVLATLTLFAMPPGVHAAPGTAIEPTPENTSPTPLLWKVSDQDNAIYLLGSFHLLKSSDYPTGPEIDDAFEDAGSLVFEIQPDELTDPATGMKMLTASGYADGRSLSQVLAPEQLEQLDTLFKASGQSAAAVEAYEPWFINLTLVMGMSQAMGFSSADGLDQHLIKRASEAGKVAQGLETIDQQLTALDSMPMNEQVAALNEFLDDPAQARLDLTEMHDAWRRGDVEALSTLAIAEMKMETPESYRLVNVERNDAWVPQLRQLLDAQDSDNTLVVVGAMHLLGEDGVVEKLRAHGYTVERICEACDKD